MSKKVTEVMTEDELLSIAVRLVETGNNEMSAIPYQVAGVFAQMSIAVSLKRLADMKEVEMNWAAGNYSFTGEAKE